MSILKYNAPKIEIEGWISDEELQWLYERASLYNSVVEVGSWKGKSTHALLSGCRGKVYAVDHFLGNEAERDNHHIEATQKDIGAEFSYNLRMFPHLEVYRMSSVEASRLFKPKSVDMVFIDGDHAYEYVSDDLRVWENIPTKLFCGHDRGQDGVPRALGELLERMLKRNIDFYIKGGPGSIWYIDLR